ncbi:hypothetical protein ES702_06922 [subsurface metagenome]
MIDLNEEEVQVLRDHVTRLGIVNLEVEDWRKIRAENRIQFVELLGQFYNMTEDLRSFYLKQYLEDEKEEPGEEQINPELRDSTLAIINMDQEKWDGLSEATQRGILQRFELIEQAGKKLADEEIEEGTPEEIKTILNATEEEWSKLPDSVTEAILRKFEKLAG